MMWRPARVYVVALALLALCVAPTSAKDEPPGAPAHVIVVIFGGGVRQQELLDEQLMPNVAAIAAEGVIVDRVRCDATSAFDGATRILTGRDDAMAAPNDHPTQPTLMEYVRVATGVEQEKVWFVSFEGEDQLDLAHSLHTEFGPAVGPAVTHGMGPFAEPLSGFLDRLGRPDPMPEEAWSLLRPMRAANRKSIKTWLPSEVRAGTEASERVERALLRDLDRRNLLVRVTNPRDERAWRCALTVIAVHQPKLTVIRLGEASQAVIGIDKYRKVLRANDGGLGRVRRAVANDKAMSGRTLWVLTADHGRNEKPNARGGLDADDDSKSHRHLSVVLSGPGLKPRARMKGKRRIEDLCPTVGALMGVQTPRAQGAAWTPIFKKK